VEVSPTHPPKKHCYLSKLINVLSDDEDDDETKIILIH